MVSWPHTFFFFTDILEDGEKNIGKKYLMTHFFAKRPDSNRAAFSIPTKI